MLIFFSHRNFNSLRMRAAHAQSFSLTSSCSLYPNYPKFHWPMRTQNHRYSQWLGWLAFTLRKSRKLIMMILMMPGFPGKSAKSGACRKQGNLENWLGFFWQIKPGYHYFHSHVAIKDKTTLNRFHSLKWCKDHWILVDLTKSIYKWCWFFFFAKIKCKYQLFKQEHQIKTAAQD